MSLSTIELITMLRDRLEEAADCMDCGLDIIRNAGLTTADTESQIEASRYFVAEANNYLAARGHLNSCEYLNRLTGIRRCVGVLRRARMDTAEEDTRLKARAPFLYPHLQHSDNAASELTEGIRLLQIAEVDLKKDLKHVGGESA